MNEIQNSNPESKLPAPVEAPEKVLLFIKLFQIDKKNQEPLLSIVTQVLLDNTLTFDQAK
jgi:hypothetical protein